MIKVAPSAALFLIPLAAWGTATAQAPQRPTESLTRWQWVQEIGLQEGGKAGPTRFDLTPKVLDGAREDLSDLRLFDPAGREVPYALRVRLPRDEFRTHEARAFNRVAHPDRSAEVSLDLGQSAVAEHNRVEVSTAGDNYRRFLHLEGSDDGKEWKPILDRRPLSHFTHEGSTFDGRQLSYPASRYRYLRVRVYPDPGIDNDRPGEPQVRVLYSVKVPGREVTWPAELGPRQAGREQFGGEYASEWSIGLSRRERVPWHRLEFDADEAEFTRNYRLEQIDDPPRPSAEPLVTLIAQGEWQRTGGRRDRLVIALPTEIIARRLRLVVIDQRNPPLTLKLTVATAAAREVIFDRPAAGPLKLYFGYPDAANPGYDYGRTLSDHRDREPPAAQPGDVQANPEYVPPAVPRVPMTERSPAVTYVVFGLVAALLLAILAMLARRAIAEHDRADTPAPVARD